MEAVYKTMASGITPVAMEFLDNLTIRAVEKTFNKGLPVDAGAILVTDVDGNLEEDLRLLGRGKPDPSLLFEAKRRGKAELPACSQQP